MPPKTRLDYDANAFVNDSDGSLLGDDVFNGGFPSNNDFNDELLPEDEESTEAEQELGVHHALFDPYTYPEFSNLPIPIIVRFNAQYPTAKIPRYLPDGFKMGKSLII